VLVEGQQEQVRAAQARLPERQRKVLVLRELEELSYDDIAAIMTRGRAIGVNGGDERGGPEPHHLSAASGLSTA
jgi:hypothetical protein